MIRGFIGAAFWGPLILLGTISANASLDEGLVFYLTFDEVTDQTIIDKSGNGLNAEILNYRVSPKEYLKGSRVHYSQYKGKIRKKLCR